MRNLQSLNLTDAQKQALATVLAGNTPQQSLNNMSGDEKIMSAAKILAKVGLITMTDAEASITNKGLSVMRDYELADQTGQITAAGQELAQHPSSASQQAVAPTGGDQGVGGPDLGSIDGLGDIDIMDVDATAGEFDSDSESQAGDQVVGPVDHVDEPDEMTADKQALPKDRAAGRMESFSYSLLKKMI